MVTKPVSFNKSTYLRVPREVEELLGWTTNRVCSVTLDVSEKGCRLVYTFASPVHDLTEEPVPRGPLWLLEEQIQS